jgi:hypothetical protein
LIKSRRIKWTEEGTRVGDRRGTWKVVVWKSEANKSLRRREHRWEHNIKWIFNKWHLGMDWSDLAQDRDRWRAFANVVIILQVA